MLGLEILDQVERMNRWKNGIEMFHCGLLDPLTTNEGGGSTHTRHSVGGIWIDSDSFLFGFFKDGTSKTYRYTLSTNTILYIGEGPFCVAGLVKEQASGIIWQQGGTSWDVQTYNATAHAWTVVLALAAQGWFAYNSLGILYFKDTAANYYTCINGAMTVASAPAGVTFPTTTVNMASYPSSYRYLQNSAMTLTVGSPTPLLVKTHAGVDKAAIMLWHNPILAMGKNTADMTLTPHLGLTTTPYNRLTYTIWQGNVQGASVPLYNDWIKQLLSRTFPDPNYQCWRMKSVLYNMSTDLWQPLLDFMHPSSIQADAVFSTANPKPCVARDYGSYISVWMLGLTELTTTKGADANWYCPLIRFDIPLR